MKDEQKRGTVIYVYALLDEKNTPVYIGKSSSPKARCYAHAIHYRNAIRMKILDFFYDVESYWISKYLDEGCNLHNRQVDICEEEWKVGDILEVGKMKKIQVQHTTTGTIYPSIATASKDLQIEYSLLLNILKHPEKPIYKEYNIIKVA